MVRAKEASRLIQFVAIVCASASLLAGCGALTGSQPAKPGTGAPSNLAYTENPALYHVGVTITANVPTADGASIAAYSISPSTLPSGLAFDSSTGIISGTPTAIAATATYTVTATNGHGSIFVNLSITVGDTAPTMSYGGSTTLSYTVGSAISTITPSLGGGAVTGCSSTPALPAGLSLDSQCVLSGTPTTPTPQGTYTVTASNTGGTASLSFTITVKDVAPSITFPGSPYTLTRGVAITTTTPTNTGGSIVSCSSSPALPAGLSLASNCAVSGTPTTVSGATSYTITATNSGGNSSPSVTISVVDVLPAISYVGSPFTFTRGTAIPTLNAVNTGGVINTCSVAPTLPAGLSLNNTTCAISGTPTGIASATVYTITASNSAGPATTAINIAVHDIAPALAYPGSPYTFTNGTTIAPVNPTSTGGVITGCSISPALPTGLAISSSCVISGTPTLQWPTTNYLVTATNSGGVGTASLSIKVNEIAPVLSYSGSPYTWQRTVMIPTQTPTNTGGPVTSCNSVPALPTGLALSSTCVVSGTPTIAVAAANYTITGTNVAGSASATVNIKINPASPSIAYTGSPYVFSKGVAIATFSPSNSGDAITSCTSAPGLPAGLAINATTCAISGTPTAITAGANYTITATNAGGSSNNVINIAVNDVAPSISFAASPYSFTLGTPITPVTPTNSGGAITGCTSTPALPVGLTLNTTTCAITGTPSGLVAATGFVIKASNTGGNSSVSIVISVHDVAPTLSYSTLTYAFPTGTAITPVSPTTGGGAITSCSSTPGLPTGLTLNNVTCAISGTPTAVSPAVNYTITASNTGGSASQVLNIAVVDLTPVISYAGTPFTFTKGVAIPAQTPTNTGGAITSCSSSPTLPPGLILGTDCKISGAATVLVPSANYVIQASNSGGSGSTVITLTVNDVIPALAFAGNPFSFWAGDLITTQTPTNSGGAIIHCTSTPALPTGLALDDTTCAISGTPTVVSAAASYTITPVNSGGSAPISIQIAVPDPMPTLTYTPASFAETVRVAITPISPTVGGKTFSSCTSSPALPAGLSIDGTTCAITGTPTVVSGATIYTITATNAAGSVSPSITFTIKDQLQVIYSGLSDLSGATNGSAPGSRNVWTGSLDGLVHAALTANAAAALDSIFPSLSAADGTVLFSSLLPSGGASLSYNLFTLPFSGGSATALTSNTNLSLDSDDPPVFSADGTKVVFASKMSLDGLSNGIPTGSYNIWVMNSDGTGKVPLTSNTNAGLDSRSPVFSPDGTTVYFSSLADLTGIADGTAAGSRNIWKVAANGSSLTPLTSESGAGFDCIEPSVSPDGSTVAYASLSMVGGFAVSSYNVWTIGSNGSGAGALTTSIAAGLDSRTPSYSPDGTRIVFASKMTTTATSASFNIWTMSSAGAGQTYLTSNTAAGLDSVAPSFSPDNAHIVFQSTQAVGGIPSSSNNVWVMSPNGSAQVPITSNTNAGLDSYLSPHNVWYQP